MKLTNADTARMREIGSTINSLALEYEKEINKMFNRMINVPSDTHEWTGQVADRHSKLVALEKLDFLDFSNRIKTYGNKILNDAEDIDNRIKLNAVEEKN